jgi:hypothetical protein
MPQRHRDAENNENKERATGFVMASCGPRRSSTNPAGLTLVFYLFVVILFASVPLWHVLLSRQGLVTHCPGLGGKTGKTGKRFLFILREHDVARQAKHFEELHCLALYVGEDNQCAAFFRDVDNAEEDGNTDTVHQLSVAEIDNERSAA